MHKEHKANQKLQIKERTKKKINYKNKENKGKEKKNH